MHASAPALWHTFLACIVHHRLELAALTIRGPPHSFLNPILIPPSPRSTHYAPIHPAESECCVPVSSAKDFCQRYSSACELALFEERADLVARHPERLAAYLTKELFEE